MVGAGERAVGDAGGRLGADRGARRAEADPSSRAKLSTQALICELAGGSGPGPLLLTRRAESGDRKPLPCFGRFGGAAGTKKDAREREGRERGRRVESAGEYFEGSPRPPSVWTATPRPARRGRPADGPLRRRPLASPAARWRTTACSQQGPTRVKGGAGWLSRWRRSDVMGARPLLLRLLVAAAGSRGG
jgi:hypothetical protein